MWIIGSIFLWFLNWYYYIKDELSSIFLVLRIKLTTYRKLSSKDVVHLAVRTNDQAQFDDLAFSHLVEHVKETYEIKFLSIVSRNHCIKMESLHKEKEVQFYYNYQKVEECRGEVKLSVNLIDTESQLLLLKKWVQSCFTDSKILSKLFLKC